MEYKYISTDKAPLAIGPYSQAVLVGDFVFSSGQIPINPLNGELVNTGIAEATEQVMENLKAVLAASGADLSDVVKTTVFLSDMKDFQGMNEIYGKYFSTSKPSRSCVQVSALPKGALVEIEAIAIRE